MSPETFWFVLALIVTNQIVIGLFCRYVAYEKNRDGETWFWLGALLGPMPIALLQSATPPRQVWRLLELAVLSAPPYMAGSLQGKQWAWGLSVIRS